LRLAAGVGPVDCWLPTDGRTPSDTVGTPYTGPIAVAATATIKAIAYKSGLANGKVSTATYTIRD
jgi:hypothetical protein